VIVRLALLLPLALIACGPTGNSPEAECTRQAEQDPTVQSIYRGDQGNYTEIGPAHANLIWDKKQAYLKCMREKGLAPPVGVEPIRPPTY
jgi:hypothetical protein